MLEAVTKGFRAARERLGRGPFDTAAIDDAMRDIRLSLLEADVELGVARGFLERVRARAETEILPGVATIQVGGERLHIPANAAFNIEHERSGKDEELEFQLIWKSESK